MSAAALGVVALSSVEAGSAGPHRTRWILLSVAMTVVGVVVPRYEDIRKERDRRAGMGVVDAADPGYEETRKEHRRRVGMGVLGAVLPRYWPFRRERARRRAVVQMRVTMNDALDPIVRHLGRLAKASDRERETMREATIPMILYSAVHLIGAEKTRACWYRLIEDSPRRLVPDQDAGRADQPEQVFEQGTPEGDQVFDLIQRNEHLVYTDVDAEAPPGWRTSGYRSFVAVPVVAGQTAYGMLTVDTVNVGGVTEDDVTLLRVLAGLLGAACAYGQPEGRSRRLGAR